MKLSRTLSGVLLSVATAAALSGCAGAAPVATSDPAPEPSAAGGASTAPTPTTKTPAAATPSAKKPTSGHDIGTEEGYSVTDARQWLESALGTGPKCQWKRDDPKREISTCAQYGITMLWGKTSTDLDDTIQAYTTANKPKLDAAWITKGTQAAFIVASAKADFNKQSALGVQQTVGGEVTELQ